MSKLGAHIVQGSRNGYGSFCTSKPAVIVAVDEGGALGEAWVNSGGHTFTVFRDTTVYLEAPIEWNQTSDMIALARLYYPHLKNKWLQNPAEYYTITNETGGGEGPEVEANYRKLVAYEREVMRLANLDGFKVCILNCAGGSPGDINIWRNVCLPFILEAGLTGNVYGRHVYGQGNLVGNDGKVISGNPSRPLEESDILAASGYRSGIILTECGIDGGYGYAGDRFIAQMKAYEGIIRGRANIIAMACWTGGDWNDANCQDAFPALTQYNLANPTPKWTPGEVPPPQPPTGYKSVVFKIAQEHTVDEWAGIARLAHQEYKRTLTASGDNCLVMVGDGNAESYAVIFDPALPSQAATIQQLTAAGLNYQTRTYRQPPPTNPQIQVVPINQRDPRWANVDMGGEGKTIGNWGCLLVAYLIHAKHWKLCNDDPPAFMTRLKAAGAMSGPYLLPVALRTAFPDRVKYLGYETRSVLLDARIKASIDRGIPVPARVDFTPATGQFEQHWVLITGYTANDFIMADPWHGDIAPLSSRYNITGNDVLEGIFYELLPVQPPTATIDLLPYIKGDGRLYEVRTVDGGQERFQCQSSGPVFWQTKNSSFEELSYDIDFIWRGLDISPGPAPSYAERPGVLRYYTAKEPNMMRARWCKRFMAVGETFTGSGHQVQFYYQDTCQTSSANSGPATNKTTLKAKHASKVWNGITIQDVIEMTNGIETWFFARGYGLVAWNDDKASSAISEVHAPGTRPDNVRQAGCWG